ncbi:MAG: class I SAM-dependent methyltransferase [Cyanobacteria bacterium P01_A01_bin.123]
MGMGRMIKYGRCLQRDAFILAKCKDKKILHVGCTDHPFFEINLLEGNLLHQKVASIDTQKLVGIDVAGDDVYRMQSLNYDVRLVNAESMASDLRSERFDIVLLADVIEHIQNPGIVIRESMQLLEQDGKIIISVPNAFGIIRFLKSFFRYEQVHPDHICYYSFATLETLADRMGLEVIEINWYQFEARDKRLIVKISASLERVFTRFFPWQAEGCIALLKKKNDLN